MTKSKNNKSSSKILNKAIGYARVSTERQKTDGNSVPLQIEAIGNYAIENDLDLIEILDESKSATKIKKSSTTELVTNRPAFEEILVRAAKHEFNHLILTYRDRLARDFSEALVIKSLLFKANVTIHYVGTSEKLSENDDYIDKFTDLVFSNIAMLEAGLIGQRAKGGQKQNIENGYYAGGPVAYGYNLVNHPIAKKKIFIKDIGKAHIVKRIFSLYNLRFSYSEITKIINDEFPSENIKSFSKSTLSQIINNEMYIGNLIWNRKSKHQLGENDDIVRSLLDDNIKIVSSDFFNRIHEIKNSKMGINNMSYTSNFLLKGKLICGGCTKPLKAKNYGKGKKSVYYCSCNNEKYEKLINNKMKSYTKWSISIPQKEIEVYVFNLLYSHIGKPIEDTSLIEKYYSVYSNILRDEKNNVRLLIDKKKVEVAELDAIIIAGTKVIENNLILKNQDVEFYNDNFFIAINKTISLVSIRKNNLEIEIKTCAKIADLDVMSYEQFRFNFSKVFSSFRDIKNLETKELCPSELRLKRMIIDDIIDKITVNHGINGETLSVFLKIPNISATHNFEFLQTCPIHKILSI